MKKEECCYSLYMKEVVKIPLLTQEEELALATKAAGGNKPAQKKLVESNLRLVVKIAKQYEKFWILEDLINEGNIGLMHAAEKYVPSKGAKFSSYAAYWIRANIQKAICESSKIVRFPANKYKEMILDKWNMVSIDAPIDFGEGDGATFGDYLCDEKNLSLEDEQWRRETIETLFNFLHILNDTERFVVLQRYGIDGSETMSLSELAKIFNCSKEKIRKLEINALKKMHSYADKNKIQRCDLFVA